MRLILVTLVCVLGCSSVDQSVSQSVAQTDSAGADGGQLTEQQDASEAADVKTPQPAIVCTEKLCDDGNSCTVDLCTADGCTHLNSPTLTNCSDDNACTLDSCDPLSGCVHLPMNCSDTSAWTMDVCSDGGCSSKPYEVLVGAQIDVPESKPPTSFSLTVFINGLQKTAGMWTPDEWPGKTNPLLEMMCLNWTKYTPAETWKWNVGYLKSVGGYFDSYVFLGGESVSLSIGFTSGLNFIPAFGVEQPVLVPDTGTQLYASDGLLIPQSFLAVNLGKICQEKIAEQKVLDGK